VHTRAVGCAEGGGEDGDVADRGAEGSVGGVFRCRECQVEGAGGEGGGSAHSNA